MSDEQVVNRTWEIAAAMVKLAVVGILVLVGGMVALVAAVIGIVTLFFGRVGRALGERIGEAREWAAKMAGVFVSVLCVVGLVGAMGWGVYWIWMVYGGEKWTWVLLAANVVVQPLVLSVVGGMNRGAALVLSVVIFAMSWLTVNFPVAAVALAGMMRVGGNYMIWRIWQ